MDHRKTLPGVYCASARKPALLSMPPLNYLSIEGSGHPDQPEYQDAVRTLYPIAYFIKFAVRRLQEIDFRVLPLETIWTLDRSTKGSFAWQALILQPDLVNKSLVDDACRQASSLGNVPLLERLRFVSLDEGLCVQMLHTGPYEGMNQTLQTMLEFSRMQGLVPRRMDTHDIYLNDMRKTRPENLRAIMRLPVSQP